MDTQATGQFISSIETSKNLLNQLQQHLDNFLGGIDPDHVHWGHVGDAKHIETSLQELLDWLEGEAE